MIWTLNIRLERGRWMEGEWAATIAVDAASTLHDLHDIIRTTVKFSNDHLYDFFIARTPWSHKKTPCDPTKALPDIFPLSKGHKLFDLYDYGDNWTFQIGRTRKRPFMPEPEVQYPQLIGENGKRPRHFVTAEIWTSARADPRSSSPGPARTRAQSRGRRVDPARPAPTGWRGQRVIAARHGRTPSSIASHVRPIQAGPDVAMPHPAAETTSFT